MNVIASVYNLELGDVVAAVQHAPQVRVEKVLMIRCQLGEGRYYIAEKLNVVVDRILEDLLNHNCKIDNS
jgi:hypothetical protein